MKVSILCIIISIGLITGCETFEKFIQFDMEYNENITIPAATGVNLPFDINTPEVETNSESTFSTHNTSEDLIDHIVLNDLILTLTDPAGADFSFLKSVRIYISASDLPETLIAWDEEISENIGNTLDLETSDTDLSDYLSKNKFKLRVNAVTDKVLTEDHQLDLHSNYGVRARLF